MHMQMILSCGKRVACQADDSLAHYHAPINNSCIDTIPNKRTQTQIKTGAYFGTRNLGLHFGATGSELVRNWFRDDGIGTSSELVRN